MGKAAGSELRIGSTELRFEGGNISDWVGKLAVVSSDGNYLSHSGGVSRAIWEMVGESNILSDPAVVELAKMSTRPTVGQVIETGGREGIPRVIHAVTMDLDLDETLTAQSATTLYSNVFEAVDLSTEREVALPLLGTGTAGLAESASLRSLLLAASDRGVLPFQLHVHVICHPPLSADDLRQRAVEVKASLGAAEQLFESTQAAEIPERYASGVGAALRQLLKASDYETAEAAGLLLWAELDEASPENLTRDGLAPTDLSIVRKAREARNRLAHVSGNTELVRVLLRGCLTRLSALSKSQPSRPEGKSPANESAGAEQTYVRHHPLAEEESAGQPRSEGLTTRRRWSPNGTEHVRALRDLILDVLDDESLELEHQRLQELGLRGGRDECLLETCVADDPMEVLRRHFSGARLRRILEQHGVQTQPYEEYETSAQNLLEQLGFPPRVRLMDVQSVHQQLLAFESELGTAEATELFGRVTRLAREVERVLQIYVRFLTEGVLLMAPDAWLADARSRGKCLKSPAQYTKATMGQLIFDILKELGSDIDRSTDSRVRLLAQEVKGNPRKGGWVPPSAFDIPARRNHWIHGDDDFSSEPTIEELRSQAREFCRLALETILFLINGPFPETVLIEEMNLDRWGRKRVKARTGRNLTELIFTDVDVVPGQAYLMHTRTNPLRVDPVLVPMGLAQSHDSPA